MVTATPRLSGKVDVRTSRKDGNRALFKKFPGMVTSYTCLKQYTLAH